MENNLSVILKNAEEKINSNEWSSALDILGDIDCNDCSYDEIEQILWLKIDCWSLAAARICVMEFSPEEMDDNFNNITDIISNLIVKLFVNICLNEKQNRAGELYIKFYNILEDRFISVLDEAISEITSVKASGRFFLFTTRHAVFCAELKIVFLCAAKESEIPIEKIKKESDNKIEDITCKADEILCQKQFDHAVSLTDKISKLIPDFPYVDYSPNFDASQIGEIYLTAERLLENIIEYTTEEDLKVKSLKLLIATYCDHMNCVVIINGYRLSILTVTEARNKISNKINEYQNQLRTYINDYEHPPYNLESINDSKATNSGCYIATAVYGSYDCPEVWTLRRYRDNILSKTRYGRLFIKIYYAISPKLVKWFGTTQWFKMLWRHKLDKKVLNLQKSGVKSTPYIDK